MRCLYCGKPLPLLKKLTGGGEFCSDAHRHKYQEEYNKLALSRLLQAQSPSADGAPARNPRQLAAPGARPGQRALPPPATRQIAAPAAPLATPPPVLPIAPITAAPAKAAPVHDAPPPSFQPPSFQPPVVPAAAAEVPAPAAVSAPPPPLPPPAPEAPPMPDPPYAAFRLDPVPAAKPAPFRNSLGAAPELPGEEAGVAAQFAMESGLAADPFDWQSFEQSVEEASEPAPPEAAPWEHPISAAAPPPVPALLIIEAEWKASPLFPAMPEQDIPIRYPKPVLRKAAMPETVRSPLAPAQPERVAGRSWEVSLGLPAWKPQLSIVMAPAIGQPVPVPAATSDAVQPEMADAPGAAMELPPPAPEAEVQARVPAAAHTQSPEPVHQAHQEVFVDLSILEKLGLV